MAEHKKPPKTFNPILRVVASVYILYLAFGMIRDFGQVPQNQRMFIGISTAVFIVMPCWFLYTAYKDWKQIKAEEAAEQQAAREAEALNPPPDDEEDLDLDIDADEQNTQEAENPKD